MGEYDSTTGAWDKVAHLRCRDCTFNGVTPIKEEHDE